MGVFSGPDIKEDGLVLALDGANYKSFKGVPATNILNQISYTSGNTNTALFKYTQGSENVNIPSLGYVNSKYVDFYNDYNGGSGNCCPTLFYYGTGLAASPSTTYTYSIIYKTTTGYTHPNYMYRYEFNSSGTYLTEAGVHSDSNRTSLGDGWWFAWGQFTTQATTARLDTYLYHYEYATQNRVYVYKAALYAGTYVIPPEHMLNSGEVRGATVATGGGWADIIGNSNNGELVNGPTYSSANGGSLIFDGVNDKVSTNYKPSGARSYFIWVKFSSLTHPSGYQITGTQEVNAYTYIGIENGGGVYYYAGASTGGNIGNPVTVNTWVNLGFALFPDGSRRVYKNGIEIHYNTGGLGGTATNEFSVGCINNSYHITGNIAQVSIYNRALTAAEVSQNFNALRGRFGI